MEAFAMETPADNALATPVGRVGSKIVLTPEKKPQTPDGSARLMDSTKVLKFSQRNVVGAKSHVSWQSLAILLK